MEKERPKSEAGEMDAFLAGLAGGGAVREIAGWRSGFAALDGALNGISPGLHLLVGPTASGKTALARQASDQVARLNSVPALFFALAEKITDLRIRTLARLSGLETREIRRGAGWLLHAYGAPKQNVDTAAEMAPGWDRLKLAAAEAKPWLDRVYLYECDRRTGLDEIEGQIRAARDAASNRAVMVAIDDAQRLGDEALPFDARLPLVMEKLHRLALGLDTPVLATWPELEPAAAPERWAERAAGADAVMVLREEARAGQTEAKRRMALHIVKNRGGEKTAVRLDFSPGLAKFSEPAGKNI